MRAGALRHRLTIVARSLETAGEFGEQSETWDEDSGTTVWGSIEFPSGREYFQAGQVQAEYDARIRIRGGQTITTTHRLWHAATSTWYEIVTILDRDARGVEVELLCKRRA